MERIHVVGARLGGLGDLGRKYPSGVQGQSPVGGLGPGDSPPEAEVKCEICVQF